MKTRMFLRMFTVVFLALATASVARAQKLPEGDLRNAEFRIHFQEVVALNPDVKDFQKMREGALYALPGGKLDTIASGDVNGIWGREFKKYYGISYEDFLKGKAVAALPVATTGPVVGGVETVATSAFVGSTLFWILLVAAAIVLFLLYAKRQIRLAREREAEAAHLAHERELRRDPVTSGTPYVPGGIPVNEPERLENFFDRQATSRYAGRTGLDPATVIATRVGPIEEGTIQGEGMIGYLGGEMRPRRIETPIRAYQARYRFEDGTEELLQCLMGCMNPVSYGGDVFRGFTFTPAQDAVPAREPQQQAALAVLDTAPLELPAEVASLQSPADEHIAPGVVKFEVRPATEDQPAMIRMSGVNERGANTYEVAPGVVTFRYTPRGPDSSLVN